MNQELPKPTKLHYFISVLYMIICAIPCVGAIALIMSFKYNSLPALVPASVILLFGYFQYSALFRCDLAHSTLMFNSSMVLGILALFTFGLLSAIIVIGIIFTPKFEWTSLLYAIATAFPPLFLLIHANVHQTWLKKLETLPHEISKLLKSKKFTLRELFLLTTIVALMFGAAKLLSVHPSNAPAPYVADFID